MQSHIRNSKELTLKTKGAGVAISGTLERLDYPPWSTLHSNARDRRSTTRYRARYEYLRRLRRRRKGAEHVLFRTTIREVRWLLVCGPLLGGLVLNGCLSDNASTNTGDDPSTGTGAGGDGATTAGAGGSDGTTSGAAGSGVATTGVGGASSTGVGGASSTGAGGAGVGGSTGAGGGSVMVGSMTGNVKGGVRWVGRFDATSETAIKFNWGGSGFVANVTATGATIAVTMTNENPTYFQGVLDGKPALRSKANQGMGSVPLAMNVPAGMHTIEFYRETEAANNGVSTFNGITGATLGTPPPIRAA